MYQNAKESCAVVQDPARDNEMRKITLYVCRPEKNTKCHKLFCAHNPNATHPVCSVTDQQEYAETWYDGTPKMAPRTVVADLRYRETTSHYWEMAKKEGEKKGRWKAAALAVAVVAIVQAILLVAAIQR